MRYLLIVFLLNGCAEVGEAMQAAGGAISTDVYRKQRGLPPEPKPVTCTQMCSKDGRYCRTTCN